MLTHTRVHIHTRKYTQGSASVFQFYILLTLYTPPILICFHIMFNIEVLYAYCTIADSRFNYKCTYFIYVINNIIDTY